MGHRYRRNRREVSEELQADGNLVLYAGDRTPRWATNTDGKGGKRLVMQDDGNLVIRTDEGKPIWASNTATS